MFSPTHRLEILYGRQEFSRVTDVTEGLFLECFPPIGKSTATVAPTCGGCQVEQMWQHRFVGCGGMQTYDHVEAWRSAVCAHEQIQKQQQLEKIRQADGDVGALCPGSQRMSYEYHSYRIRSGKRLHNYRKSPFLMGKSSINGNFQ